MDESNTLIDNSEAGELVHNNSQWHPGFSALGSVPGMLPTETLTPTLQTVAQAGPNTIPDEDPESEIDTVNEEYDEMDEEMDDEDSFDDDAFEEGTLDEGVTALGTTSDISISFQPTAPGITPPDPLSHTPDAPENASLPLNETLTLSSDDSDLPDLEDESVEDPHEQQTTEGNPRTPFVFVRLANPHVLSGPPRLQGQASKTRKRNGPVL